MIEVMFAVANNRCLLLCYISLGEMSSVRYSDREVGQNIGSLRMLSREFGGEFVLLCMSREGFESKRTGNTTRIRSEIDFQSILY